MDKSGQVIAECWRKFWGINSKLLDLLTILRLTAEKIKNLNALSGVAYQNSGAIFPFLVAPNPAPKPALRYFAFAHRRNREGRSPAKKESSSPGSHRIGFYSRLRNACLFMSLRLFELADVGGLLQIIMVKRGSHSFPVRLPDSQLAGVFVPTRDHLPHLTDNRPRALRG